jgi:hypothetical protein
LVFFAGADVEERHRLAGVEALLEIGGTDQHFPVALVAGEQFGDRVLDCNLVAIAHLGECFVIAVGAGLATADVVGCEEGPAGPRKAREEVFHAIVGAEVYCGSRVHVPSMERIAENSSVCVDQNGLIVTAR